MSKPRSSLGEPGRLGLIGIIVAALAGGLGAGFYLSRPAAAQSSKPDAPIEWNQVQAVPTRPPDAEDKEWQERSNALDEPASNSASPRTGAQNEAQ